MLLATLWPKKRACLTPEKVEACVIVKSNLGLLRDMGFWNKWEVNVWWIDRFFLASLNQRLIVHVEYSLLKNQKFKKLFLTLLQWSKVSKQVDMVNERGWESLRIQSFKGFRKFWKIPGLDFWESRDPAGAWLWVRMMTRRIYDEWQWWRVVSEDDQVKSFWRLWPSARWKRALPSIRF